MILVNENPRKLLNGAATTALMAARTTSGREGSSLVRMWQPERGPRRLCQGKCIARGEEMPDEKLRAQAAEKRRLAENARRLAALMHQVDVRRDLVTEADTLEQLAHA